MSFAVEKTIGFNLDGVYLNLHPLFTDQQGNLRSNFTTDGLHLSPPGYLVWRTALQMYTNQQLTPQLPQPQKVKSTNRI